MENLQVGIRYRWLSVGSWECCLQSSPCQCLKHIILGLEGSGANHTPNSVPFPVIISLNSQVPQQSSWSPVNWSCAVEPDRCDLGCPLSSALTSIYRFPTAWEGPRQASWDRPLLCKTTAGLQADRWTEAGDLQASYFSEGVLVSSVKNKEGKNRGFPDLTPARVGAKALPSENRGETLGSEERKEDWWISMGQESFLSPVQSPPKAPNPSFSVWASPDAGKNLEQKEKGAAED